MARSSEPEYSCEHTTFAQSSVMRLRQHREATSAMAWRLTRPQCCNSTSTPQLWVGVVLPGVDNCTPLYKALASDTGVDGWQLDAMVNSVNGDTDGDGVVVGLIVGDAVDDVDENTFATPKVPTTTLVP